MEHLHRVWEDTLAIRQKVQDALRRIGVTGIEGTPCWSDLKVFEAPQVSAETDSAKISALLGQMADPKSPNYNGFYLLNLSTAIRTELKLIESLQQASGEIPVRQMAAFKANHSALLQYMRLQTDPNAGIDVAGIREAISACSIGFRPESIVYSNPNFSERDLLVCTTLGISTFCFDHPAKLEIVSQLKSHGIRTRDLQMILRLNSPFSESVVEFERFGIDIDKNKILLQQIIASARRHDLQIAGVSFHVGIGARSFSAYENVFEFASNTLKLLPRSKNGSRKIVNVGGGFAFNHFGQKYRGTLSSEEQIQFIGHSARKLNSEVPDGIEILSEIGQGYVGAAGSVFTRVDVCERRENPSQELLVSPIAIPGAFTWGHHAKRIFASAEQWITGPAGYWSFPIQRLATLYPEIWVTSEDGSVKKLDVPEKDMMPTLIFGKTCDPTDVLNPRVLGEYIRFLLPDISRAKYNSKYKTFALRFCSAAYMDSAGDFNGQTVQSLPWHFSVENQGAISPQKNSLIAPLIVSSSTDDWEYRERVLSHGIVTASQIQQTRELIADQFIEREQMISWLIQTKQISSDREIQSLRYLLWEKVSATVDTGLSVVRLKVRRHLPDSEGEVVAAVTATILDQSQLEALPLKIAKDWERRLARVVFETEALVLRRLTRINAGLREKIFPSCYIAMSAKKPGEGGSTLELRQRVHDLARGSGLKSVSNIATGEYTTRLSQQHPEVFQLIKTPYSEISFYDTKPFDGIQFGDVPGQLSCFVRDFRGPYRFEEPLPSVQTMPIRVRDRNFKDPELMNF